MKTTRIFRAIATALLLSGSAQLLAGTAGAYNDIVAGDTAKPLDQTWPVATDARIDVGNISGKVEVTGWDQAQVKLEGSLGAGSTLTVSGDAKKLSLQVKTTKSGWFGSDAPSHDSTLILHVPKNAALDVSVVSADATVADVAGASLKVDGVSGDLTLSSAAPQIDVESVSGEVALAAPDAAAAGRTHVQTVSGDIRAKNLAGRIKLETVSGEMNCACGSVHELETGTVSGDADIVVAPVNDARLNLSSMSGGIKLRLPASLSASIDASTFSGGIRSDFGQARDAEHGSGSNLKTQVGNGGAQIKIDTFSGDVQLRKQ